MGEFYIGIDPGKSGGLAVVTRNGLFEAAYKLDETERDTVSNLDQYIDRCQFAMIEKVHSSPQMGVASAFTFGRGYGFIRGLLSAKGVPYDEVSPQKWQKAMGCLSKGDKNVTKQKAQQFFPETKITHAIADALLIAEYCRRTCEQHAPASGT